MNGPLLPGESPRPLSCAPLSHLVGRLAHHEGAFREIAAEVLERLPADDDLAGAIRRALVRFDY